jgi:hypothetical protein
MLGDPMTGQLHATPAARRSDAGTVRLGRRDIDGLILCAEHYGAPSDLLAAALGAQPARLRAITTAVTPASPERVTAAATPNDIGGIISLLSPPGRGTTLHVEFPDQRRT